LPEDQDRLADKRSVEGSTPLRSQSADQRPDAPPGGQRLLADPQVLVAVVGQAAALFAVAATVVYSAGALSIAFKLWYDGVPVLPALVQLPRSWSITQAVTELLPVAITAGLLAMSIWKKVRHSGIGKKIGGPPGAELRSARRGREAWRWAVSVALALLFTGIALLFARFFWRSPIPANGAQDSIGIYPRPWWNILILCLILDTASIRLALHFLRRVPVAGWRRIPQYAIRVIILAVAFIPILASISAPYAFPIVKLCSPEFTHPAQAGTHYTLGNLIGVSGQYVYVAEVLTKELRPGKFEFAAGYIAVIPLSEVKILAIGQNASCGPFASAGPDK
jgi:hypothetical protein